jgi:hypothetical protein
MGSFRGYTCDRCGTVLQGKDVNKKTTRLVGPAAMGEYTEDLCTSCAKKEMPKDRALSPLRGRRARSHVAHAAALA